MILNFISLVFSIFGAILLWRYGLLTGVTNDGSRSVVVEATTESIKDACKHICLSRIGLAMTILGIIFQNDIIKSIFNK